MTDVFAIVGGNWFAYAGTERIAQQVVEAVGGELLAPG